jgi:hypothetical protein
MTDVVIVNRSTVLTDAEIRAFIPAFQAQVSEDFAQHWHFTATLHFAGLLDAVPTGMWPLYILDTTDVPGAGGYHEDDTGIPTGKVFAADAIQFGEAWTVDASHEGLEMLADSDADTILPLPAPYSQYHCLQEVCDAVEADRYGYVKPRWPKVRLTDFCYPAYFTGGPGPYDAMRHLSRPAPALLSGGYLGIELPDGEWTQIIKRDELGRASRRSYRLHSRLGRRLARA